MKLYIGFANPKSYDIHMKYLNDFSRRLFNVIGDTFVQCHDVVKADIVFLIDSHTMTNRHFHELILNQPELKRALPRLFVYDESDIPVSGFRGLFVGMPKQVFDNERHIACIYWGIEDPAIVDDNQRNYSCTFRGSILSHPVRSRLYTKYRDNYKMTDTSSAFALTSTNRNADLVETYMSELSNSQFSFCPRGHGTSSFRLFECVSLGTIPIVISDDYQYPAGFVEGYNYFSMSESKLIIPDLFGVDKIAMSHNCRSLYNSHFCLSIRYKIEIFQCLNMIDKRSFSYKQLLRCKLHSLVTRLR